MKKLLLPRRKMLLGVGAALITSPAIIGKAAAQLTTMGAGGGFGGAAAPASYTHTDLDFYNPGYGGQGDITVDFTGTQVGKHTLMWAFNDTYGSREITSVTVHVGGGTGDVVMTRLIDGRSIGQCLWGSDQIPSGSYAVTTTWTFTPNWWGVAGGYVTTTDPTPLADSGVATAAAHADPQILDSAITIPANGIGVGFLLNQNGFNENANTWAPAGTTEIGNLFDAGASSQMIIFKSTTAGSWQPAGTGHVSVNGLGYGGNGMIAGTFNP